MRIKSLEIAIMALAAWGFFTVNVPALLGCVLLLGLFVFLGNSVQVPYVALGPGLTVNTLGDVRITDGKGKFWTAAPEYVERLP